MLQSHYQKALRVFVVTLLPALVLIGGGGYLYTTAKVRNAYQQITAQQLQALNSGAQEVEKRLNEAVADITYLESMPRMQKSIKSVDARRKLTI